MTTATKPHWTSETVPSAGNTQPARPAVNSGRHVTDAEHARRKATKQAGDYTREFMATQPIAATAKLEGWDNKLARFVHEVAFTQAQVIQLYPHVSLPPEDALWPLHGGGPGWNGGVVHRYRLDAVARARNTMKIAVDVPGWFYHQPTTAQHHSGAYDR